MDLRFPFSLLFTAATQLFLSISMSFLEPLSVPWQDVFLLLKKLQAHYLGHLCLDSKQYYPKTPAAQFFDDICVCCELINKGGNV